MEKKEGEKKVQNRRSDERRKEQRRESERRQSQRRGEDRRKSQRNQEERRKSDRRNTDRREEERRRGERRNNGKIANIKEYTFLEENMYEDKVEGRNSVLELLKSDRDINKIWIQRGEKHGSIHQIIALAKEQGVVIAEAEKSKLDVMSETQNHQGVIAIVPPFNYCEVDDILEDAREKNEDPFLILLDGIEDPHNLGSIIRTAETAGVHGVIIPKRRGATVNSTVSKVSAGAVEHMKIARVTNLTTTIQMLKEKGLWIVGTDMEAEKTYYEEDLTGPICIIIGSEGFGMSRLVKENTDMLVKIPMQGKISSLNASVSAGIVIYEAVKQKMSQ